MKAFFRPTTRANVFMSYVLALLKPRHRITHDDLQRWQEASFASYMQQGKDAEVLKRIIEKTDWKISENQPPPNVWFGEAKFDGRQTPRIILYQDTATTRLFTRSMFEHASQAGIDHVFGHLYAFHSGNPDYGEEMAYRLQYAVAKKRSGFYWKLIARGMPLFYRVHKDISLKQI